MSATAARLPRGPAAVPSVGWWVLLGVVLVLAFAVNGLAAAGVLMFAIIQRSRPLDFLTAYFITAAAASFADYVSGQLTGEMWILTGLLTFCLLCYALAQQRNSLTLVMTPATTPLLLYVGLTIANFARGLVIGNSPTYAGLELVACLGLGSCLLVASRPPKGRELQALAFWLWLIAMLHFALGTYIYGTIHKRAGGVYFEPFTGVVAVLLFNFALREERGSRMALWTAAMGPLVLHQLLSFTRGYWIALTVALLFSVVVHAGRGPGVGARWRRAAICLGLLVALAIGGILILAPILRIANAGEVFANRLGSSFGTEYDTSTLSNFVRLSEYYQVIERIAARPWFGYGLGYDLVVRETIGFRLVQQWYVHQNYLLVWLKQGIFGLALWIWLMVALLRVCLRGRSLADPLARTWCAGAAAMVVYCVVYQNFHFPMAEVNTVFVFALATGAAMGLTRDGTRVFRWRRAAGSPSAR